MAVIPMWQCDRDGSMFTNKKDADAHDKMLELAESFMALIEKHVDGINENQAEAIGLLLSKNKDSVIAACKGNVAVLDDVTNDAETSDKVAPISKATTKSKAK